MWPLRICSSLFNWISPSSSPGPHPHGDTPAFPPPTCSDWFNRQPSGPVGQRAVGLRLKDLLVLFCCWFHFDIRIFRNCAKVEDLVFLYCLIVKNKINSAKSWGLNLQPQDCGTFCVTLSCLDNTMVVWPQVRLLRGMFYCKCEV